MEGDLQHPPEDIPRMLDRAAVGDVDIVVASRYVAGGTAGGLANATRTAVSRASTLLTKSMFPRKLHGTTDPMTGFFLVDRDAVEIGDLRPRGFKILLEILARRQLRIGEVPFAFASRYAGESKASFAQGMRFLTQLAMLRFGRMSAFALVGGVGAIANLVIMWGLIRLGMDYLPAAIIASVVTIIGNFLLLEYLVFADMRAESGQMWLRFIKSFTFNGAEAIVRIPVLALLVQSAHIPSVLAAAITLAAAFVVRFVYHALFVYAPKKRVAQARAMPPYPRGTARCWDSGPPPPPPRRSRCSAPSGAATAAAPRRSSTTSVSRTPTSTSKPTPPPPRWRVRSRAARTSLSSSTPMRRITSSRRTTTWRPSCASSR